MKRRSGGRARIAPEEISGEDRDLKLEREAGNLVQSWRKGTSRPRFEKRLETAESALAALRLELAAMERETGRIPAEAEPGWILKELERLKALLDRDTQRAKIEIAKHLDGDLVIKPLGGERGERWAEIKVRVKPHGLLGSQEAVDLVYAPKWLRGPDPGSVHRPSVEFQFEVVWPLGRARHRSS